MKKSQKRLFLSIYFEDGLLDSRKKRDLTIAFKAGDPIYEKCKDMTSADLKALIGVSSYSELVKFSEEENRTLGNYIKHKLRQKLS